MKVIFPPLWIGGFALGTASLFVTPGLWHDASGGPTDPDMKWFFLFATIAGAAFIWWACMRLKRVRMDDRALYISNYSTEIIVPLLNVASVSENRWLNIHPITIEFHTATEFGSRIIFMPKVRWFAFWSSHPVVAELENAVDRATGMAR